MQCLFGKILYKKRKNRESECVSVTGGLPIFRKVLFASLAGHGAFQPGIQGSGFCFLEFIVYYQKN